MDSPNLESQVPTSLRRIFDCCRLTSRVTGATDPTLAAAKRINYSWSRLSVEGRGPNSGVHRRTRWTAAVSSGQRAHGVGRFGSGLRPPVPEPAAESDPCSGCSAHACPVGRRSVPRTFRDRLRVVGRMPGVSTETTAVSHLKIPRPRTGDSRWPSRACTGSGRGTEHSDPAWGALECSPQPPRICSASTQAHPLSARPAVPRSPVCSTSTTSYRALTKERC